LQYSKQKNQKQNILNTELLYRKMEFDISKIEGVFKTLNKMTNTLYFISFLNYFF
jgi:hypothetical protein